MRLTREFCEEITKAGAPDSPALIDFPRNEIASSALAMFYCLTSHRMTRPQFV